MTSNAAQGSPWLGNDSGGSALGSYDAEYDMPSQVSVNSGLTLNAVQQSITAGGVTYPFTSGVLTTYGKMEFTGGYLQISIKQPSGDGAWPALWMLPGSGAGSSGDNFEIDMQEGGMTAGSANPNDVFSYHLHDSGGTFGGDVNAGVDLSAGFNTYGMNWIPGKSITFYLNGQQVGQITSAQTTIPDEPMELIMSNEVANSSASGWHTTLDGSTPNSMPMQVADVQLYQTPGSGETIMGSNVTAGSTGTGT
ncbi:MAG: glycoside hydrolase family 16 protein, partial [Terriglobales bacterium]